MPASRRVDDGACVGVSRRDFIRTGVAGAAALGFDGVVPRAQATGARCESVVVLWMQGGVSHLDTFDPKPDAPADIRGPFRAISTNVPGIQLCEHLPRMARLADKIAFIRSMSHGEGAHERGIRYGLSGRVPLPGIQLPSFDAVISAQLGGRDGVPPSVSIPGASAGPEPVVVGDLGHARSGVSGMQLPQENIVEQGMSDGIGSGENRDAMASARFRTALNLEREPGKIRAVYGSGLGRQCLLARRLVEAGVRCVTVEENGWDHHFQAFDSLKRRLPVFDQAVSALIRDLDDRGLLQTTMVLFLTEFGRSPRINGEAGREHWPGVFSVFAAGGGVHGGQVIGASDARGESPAADIITPEDLVRTVYYQTGMDWDGGCMESPSRSRTELVSNGRVIGGMV